MHWVPHALSLSTDLGFEGAETPVEINGNPLLLAELLNNRWTTRCATRGGISRCGCRAWASKACLRSRTRAPASRRKNASGSSTALPRAGHAVRRAAWAAIVREIAQTHQATVVISDHPSPYSDLPGTRIRVAFRCTRNRTRPPTPSASLRGYARACIPSNGRGGLPKAQNSATPTHLVPKCYP